MYNLPASSLKTTKKGCFRYQSIHLENVYSMVYVFCLEASDWVLYPHYKIDFLNQSNLFIRLSRLENLQIVLFTPKHKWFWYVVLLIPCNFSIPRHKSSRRSVASSKIQTAGSIVARNIKTLGQKCFSSSPWTRR